MTGLRIWKVGPGEILCLLWGMKNLLTFFSSRSDISKFFIFFILSLGAGSFWGYMIAPNELRISDLITWLYLGVITILVYEGLKKNNLPYNEKILFLFAQAAVIWYLFLYVYSKLISRIFFGAPLWYGGIRFSGGGTNPHQIAVLLCSLCAIFLRELFRTRNKITCILGIAISLFLLIQTQSSTGLLAVVVSYVFFAFYSIGHFAPGRQKNIYSILICFMLLILIIGYGTFSSLLINWIADDSNGIGRIEIFKTFSIAFGKSPLFGLGPGIHGRNGTIEFHNTYLEVLAATGIIGGFIFFKYSILLFKKVFKADWMLLPILVSIYAYGLAGFAMRRLVYWGIVAFISVISEQMILSLSEDESQSINIVGE
ncbi:O-antigen ligase family protein [Ruminococcus albus]|nr:O-antigen ligase family protein [Ruminococcus albus]MCC3351465.1 O-antigen ligase family protein [Ruminococcus albus 8]